MAIKSITKLIGQTTIIDTETQQETVKPVPIIENIVQQNVTNVIENTTIIQQAVTESPEISAALTKLGTIESGAQVNPDLTPIVQAIETKADTSTVDSDRKSVV